MPNNFQALVCKSDLRPAYYDDFHCLMADCRLNCCMGGWHITFGKKDYLTVKKQKGSAELNAGLNHCLRRIRIDVDEEYRYGEFVLREGACPLMRDGKCGLQMEKGEKVLPFVCRTFPRREFPLPSGYLERSLSPACEGVLALLWDLTDGIDFRSDPLEKSAQKLLTFKVSENGTSLMRSFQDIRALCIDTLQDRRRPLAERMLLLGIELEPLAKGETDIPSWLERAQAQLAGGETGELLNRELLPMFLVHNVNTILNSTGMDQGLRILQKELRAALGLPAYTISRGSIHLGPYLAAQKHFDELWADREYFFENLMVTVFFHMRLPDLRSPEDLWKCYVNLCNLYSAYRFLSVLSCRDGVADCKAELFRLLVLASRSLIHNRERQDAFRDDLFRHDSATLAHMAVLLSG